MEKMFKIYKKDQKVEKLLVITHASETLFFSFSQLVNHKLLQLTGVSLY